MMADWYRKRIVVLGCGNILFGDDGFGPAVAQYCQAHHESPPDVCILDAGTSVRNVLFDILLSDRKPSRIVIVDAMDGGYEPGELFEPDVDSLPRVKIDDFSMHQLPTSNLLRELRHLGGVQISVLACQTSAIPEEVRPGLSGPVAQAVRRAAEALVARHLG
jgi:coenzyme F420 hydrogenase subunit delta